MKHSTPQQTKATTRLLQSLLFSMILLFTASCAKVTPPAPTQVNITISTAGNLNPNAEGRSSPLVLRVYQLKSASGFQKMDFMTMFENDASALGSALLKRDDIFLTTNEARTFTFEAEVDTTAIGLMAVFSRYEQSQWKGVRGIRPHSVNQITVTIGDTTLTAQ